MKSLTFALYMFYILLNMPRDTYRVGKPSLYQEHFSYRWYHLACWKQSNRQFPTPEDYADLPASIQQEIQPLLKEGE